MRLRKVVFLAAALALLVGGYTAIFGQAAGAGMGTPEYALERMGGMPPNDITGVSGMAMTTTVTGTLVDKTDMGQANIGINVTQGDATMFYPLDANGKELVAQLFLDKQKVVQTVAVKGQIINGILVTSSISEANP